MGWANCGEDSKGRLIGYAISARCDHPGCKRRIDRGLAYACGDMHGGYDFNGEPYCCEGYFCDDHRKYMDPIEGEHGTSVCFTCASKFPEWGANPDDENETPDAD